MPRAVLLAVFACLPVLSSAALPSIVHMLCDDCGWGDFGYQGTNAKHVMTPNIDALAADAHTLQLSRYHTEITCTPSRHSIVTGRSPLRDCCVGAPIGDNPIWGPATPFVVQVAKNAGYQTVQLGKWQEANNTMGDSTKWPSAVGFDTFDMIDHGSTYDMPCICMSPEPWQCFRGHQPFGLIGEGNSQRALYGRNWGRPCLLGQSPNASLGVYPRHQVDSEYITDRAVAFLAQADPTRPVYMYMAFRSVHVPYVGSPTLRANCSSDDPSSFCINGSQLTSKQLDYFSCIYGIDVAVGRVRAALQQYRTDWQNTILIVTSDNGPEKPANDGSGSTGGLKGWKRSLFEGGIRLPFLLNWPQRIARNTVSAALTALEDLPATLELIITNGQPQAQRDGVDLRAIIDAPDTFVRAAPVFVCGPVAPSLANSGVICPEFCVIDPSGTWKLIVSRTNALDSTGHSPLIAEGLYSIAENEARNVAANNPKQVKVMMGMARAWVKSVFGDFNTNCKGYFGKKNLGGPKVSIWEPTIPLWSSVE